MISAEVSCNQDLRVGHTCCMPKNLQTITTNFGMVWAWMNCWKIRLYLRRLYGQSQWCCGVHEWTKQFYHKCKKKIVHSQSKTMFFSFLHSALQILQSFLHHSKILHSSILTVTCLCWAAAWARGPSCARRSRRQRAFPLTTATLNPLLSSPITLPRAQGVYKIVKQIIWILS